MANFNKNDMMNKKMLKQAFDFFDAVLLLVFTTKNKQKTYTHRMEMGRFRKKRLGEFFRCVREIK